MAIRAIGAGRRYDGRELGRLPDKADTANPATPTRNLSILIGGGYRLKSVTPIDQFLWSPHVEVVALPEPKPERGKLPACRAFLHRHTQAPFDLALQTDTPPADNTVRFRTGACADARGKRGLLRRVEMWVTPRRRPASPPRPSSL